MISDLDILLLRERILRDLIAKAGVRDWDEPPEVRAKIGVAALDYADILLGITEEETNMALPDFFKIKNGTAKTLKSSSGTAAITLASLANGNGTSAGGRQAATLDLGEYWAQRWRIDTDFELAATPTAGNAINLFGSYGDATGAGRGNTSGSDAAYTGYSNNIDAATKQLELIGCHICTAQATSTVQKAIAGVFFPKGRYLNVVVDNRSGAAFHSSDANCVITFTPLEESVEDTL